MDVPGELLLPKHIGLLGWHQTVVQVQPCLLAVLEVEGLVEVLSNRPFVLSCWLLGLHMLHGRSIQLSVLVELNISLEQACLLVLPWVYAGEIKVEGAALPELRLNPDPPIQVLHQLLADVQTQAYAVGVDLGSSLELSKKFEEQRQIFVLDAYSCIF